MSEVNKGALEPEKVEKENSKVDERNNELDGVINENDNLGADFFIDDEDLSIDDIERLIGMGLRSEYLEELRRRKKELLRLQQIQRELNKKFAEYFYLKMTYDKLEEKRRNGRDVWADTPENRSKLDRILSQENISKRVTNAMVGMGDVYTDFSRTSFSGTEIQKRSHHEIKKQAGKGMSK